MDVYYIGEGLLNVVWQPVAQTIDLAELAFVATPYNIFSDDVYELTGFSNVANQSDFFGGLRASFEYNFVFGIGYSSFDATTGFQEGDYVKGGLNTVGTLASFAGVKGTKLNFSNASIKPNQKFTFVPDSTPQVVLDARASSATLKEKYGHLTSAQRSARIDELSSANYNRILGNDLSQQDYVYRLVESKNLKYYELDNSIAGYGGQPTYFSLDTAESIGQHMLGAQMKPSSYDTLLKIPTSELVGAKVPRPFGYSETPSTFGREYFTNSYPDYGAGGFRQFEAVTKSYSPSWIVNLGKKP